MLNYRFFVAEVPKSALQFCTSLTAPTLAPRLSLRRLSNTQHGERDPIRLHDLVLIELQSNPDTA